MDNVVGEMGIRILFAEWLDEATGERVGTGWRGDRYLVFDDGRALVWTSAWAGESEAAEFFSAETKLLQKRYGLPAGPESPGAFEANGRRFICVFENPNGEVIVIDATTREWAEALLAWATQTAHTLTLRLGA